MRELPGVGASAQGGPRVAARPGAQALAPEWVEARASDRTRPGCSQGELLGDQPTQRMPDDMSRPKTEGTSSPATSPAIWAVP